MKTLLILYVLMGMALAQGMTYKLKVSEWSCHVVRGELVAQGSVLNQSGGMLPAVRVNLRVVDTVVSRVNGVANRVVRGTNSAFITVRRLANGASSPFVVRVRPSTLRQVTCQIWFRSPDSVQIPTRVPSFR